MVLLEYIDVLLMVNVMAGMLTWTVMTVRALLLLKVLQISNVELMCTVWMVDYQWVVDN